MADRDHDQALAEAPDLRTQAGTDEAHPEPAALLLMEERLQVAARRVDAGGVRVSTRTEVRTEVARVRLEDVAVEVERVPQGRFVDAAEGPRTEPHPDGEVLVLPVYEERAVVETRLWLVEEVRLLTRRTSREAEVPVELRRQTAEVERLDAVPAGAADPPA